MRGWLRLERRLLIARVIGMESVSLTTSRESAAPTFRDRRGRRYEPAIGPRMKIFLAFLFAGVALLGATGIYLFALSSANLATGNNYTSYFSLCMVFVHTYA